MIFCFGFVFFFLQNPEKKKGNIVVHSFAFLSASLSLTLSLSLSLYSQSQSFPASTASASAATAAALTPDPKIGQESFAEASALLASLP